MKKKKCISEIFLTSKHISFESWQEFILLISRHLGFWHKWKIIVTLELNVIRYFIETDYELPPTIGNLINFLLKKSDELKTEEYQKKSLYISEVGDNLINVFDRNEIKFNRLLKRAEITIHSITETKYNSKTFLFFETKNKTLIRKKAVFNIPPKFLSVDFSSYTRFFFKKAPKYLDIQKILHLLKSDNNAVLKVDTFPYLQGSFYLNQNTYNFDKHSLVVGASGSGKSKFLSLLTNYISSNPDYLLKYKIVIIDPHAALENDIGGLDYSKVIDFKKIESSIDLFMNNTDDIVSSSELLLSLLKDLFADLYNSKLERVLRHSIHLLLTNKHFSFSNLRRLLLDVEFRNLLVKNLKSLLPVSVVDFFLTDFNELKTRSYNEAIAPIISFIDEMEILPVFNSDDNPKNIADIIKENFLSVFSLNRIKLGDKVTKTISGLIMQQMLQLIQSFAFDEHIIFIVDEVSVVENPILSRFLAEARKFGLSLILSQQYFDQISEELQKAIFANVVNYYIFRISQTDANILEENLTMKIPNDDSKESRVKFLTGLNDRECIVRISSNGLILPAFKAKTRDFIPVPKRTVNALEPPNVEIKDSDRTISEKTKRFEINSSITLREILLEQSTSRKKLRGD